VPVLQMTEGLSSRLRLTEWRSFGALQRCPTEFIDTLISEVLECPILELFG